MFISWKTDGSAGAVDTVRNWLEEGSNFTDYITWANANGRTDYKYEIDGDSITITEEWNISRAEYDALDITPVNQPQADGVTLPMVETDQHLSF